MNKKLLIIVGALVAVWYFFIRKDSATGQPKFTFAPLTTRPSISNAATPNAPRTSGSASSQRQAAAGNLPAPTGGNADVTSLVKGIFDWSKNLFGGSGANSPGSDNADNGSVLSPPADNTDNTDNTDNGDAQSVGIEAVVLAPKKKKHRH